MVEHWLLVALVAPFFWAMSNLIDVYFVEDVYDDEYDGAILSGLFQLLPWLLVLGGIVHVEFPSPYPLALLLLSGFLYLLSLFFYFRSLFRFNDVALIQTIWNMYILVTPFFAWIIFGESLSIVNYVGIGLAFLGISILAFHHSFQIRKIGKVLSSVAVSIIALSLSMVVSDRAYEVSEVGFYNGFLIFSLGAFLCAILLIAMRKDSFERFLHIRKLGVRYFLVFFGAELLAVFGAFSSQRAIDLAPSASFVAVVESLLPGFILFQSILLVLFLRIFMRDRSLVSRIYRNQLQGITVKVLSLFFVACGIYLVQ